MAAILVRTYPTLACAAEWTILFPVMLTRDFTPDTNIDVYIRCEVVSHYTRIAGHPRLHGYL